MLDLGRLFADVFAPEAGEVAAVAVDLPHDGIDDNEAWLRRREMAQRWHAALVALGEQRQFRVLPLFRYPATGMNNGDLPATGEMEGKTVPLSEFLGQTTLLLALTEYSASAPLIVWGKKFPALRAASLPRVAPAMEETALAADYREVAAACARLRDELLAAEEALIEFSTGDSFVFDFRFREPEVDDGQLPRHQPPPRLINLPSGEAYIAAYEGEKGEPSRTGGVLPVPWHGDVVRLRIEQNRVEEVLGDSEAAREARTFLFADAARRNVAELGLGCNPRARVWGNVLEDEKAGPHIALGRSEHLGGSVGPDAFSDPRHVWHEDFVFARGCPVQISRMTLRGGDGESRTIFADGSYAERLRIGI